MKLFSILTAIIIITSVNPSCMSSFAPEDEKNSDFKGINLGKKWVSKEEIEEISKKIEKDITLTKMLLPKNKQHEEAIEKLDLSHMKIESVGVHLLLQNHNFLSLKKLYLSYNNIDDDGIAAFYAASQEKNGSLLRLERLDLSNNLIEDGGALGLAMSYFPALETLLLTHNKISNTGAKSIAEFSKNFPKLKELYIGDGNPISFIERNKTFSNSPWKNH